MGFGVTAAAVTVTVATFDPLAFCEMKLHFSHTSEKPMTAKALEILSGSENYICVFSLAIQHHWRMELLFKKAKKNPNKKHLV